tara:strand:+ start:629 stop:2122 length:1494 start_codon:yes stop_codon:yes gene_type:complete
VFVTQEIGSECRYDAVLVGAGIMSTTLAVLLKEVEPDMRLLIVEKLESPGLESSFALNNAGTGHAANCELNYTPLNSEGTIEIDKALEINSSFEQSLELWASLACLGKISPKSFLHYLPHISFVWGQSDVDFLRKRYEKLSEHFAFSSMEWSLEKKELEQWMPLIFDSRIDSSPIAATRIKRGTDIDFGLLASSYVEALRKNGSIDIDCSTEVVSIRREGEKSWVLGLQGELNSRNVQTPFVFLGAGGGALRLLQKSGIAEGVSYGGFPVSGKWLICDKQSMAIRHSAKVYGKAKIGSPPMSVPHLDTRWINGKRSLLFGPFAGFSTNFLKNGSLWDLFGSINSRNILPMLQAGAQNVDLVNYLLRQVRLDHYDRIEELKNFVPTAKGMEWKLSQAGQRVQIIKNTQKGGMLKMGTEVVSSKDGSLAALLGASPGASTAVTTMLKVLFSCWSEKMETEVWKERLVKLLPSFGKKINDDFSLLKKVRERNNDILGFID